MHLVKALAAGVVGAESGTAELYRRGTSTKVSYYTDFEGATVVAATTSLSVSLDSNGSAVVYVNEYVDVVVRDSGGSQVRRFVDGAGAKNVEVRSAAFTGTNYETAASAAGEPTTLAEVLDSWLDSAGSTDFNVNVSGTATTLAAAASNTYSVFYNVKASAYGAKGDGSTNDYTAIAAAITAATTDGGIVYFPPGTYVIGTALDLPAKVSLMGAGANASIIQTAHATNDLINVAGAPTYQAQTIVGLTLRASSTNTGQVLDIGGASCKLHVKDCYIGGASNTATGGLVDVASTAGQYIRFDNCTMVTGGVGGKIIISNMANRVGRIDVVGCKIVTPASITHAAPTTEGLLQGCCFFVRDTLFDVSASVAGAGNTFSCIYAGTIAYGSVRGCEFLDSAGALVTCMALGTLDTSAEWFEEDANQVSQAATYLTLYSLAHSADGYYVRLGTREARYKEYSFTGTGANALDFINYGVIAVVNSFAGGSSYTATVGPMGAKTSLLLVNSNGTARVFTLSTGIKSFGVYTIAASSAQAAGFEFTSMSPTAGAGWYLTGFSGSDATDDSYTL